MTFTRYKYFRSKFAMEALEARRLLAVTALDDRFSIPQGRLLTTERDAVELLSIDQEGVFSSRGGVSQIEASTAYNIVAVRNSATQIRIFDTESGEQLSSLLSTNTFTDFDLTPDGRFLFVADFGGEIVGSGTPILPHFVHRLDLESMTWMTKAAPSIAWKIEAVNAGLVLLQSQDQFVEITLNTFPADVTSTMSEMSRIYAGYEGDLEYDGRTNRIYQGSVDSDIHVSQVEGNALRNVQVVRSIGAGSGIGEPTSLLSADGSRFYVSRLQMDARDVRNDLRSFPEPIRAATSAVAFGRMNYYSANTAESLGNIGFLGSAHHASDDGRHVWVFNDNDDTLVHFTLNYTGLGLLANDTQTTPGTLAAALASYPAHGTLTKFNTNGTFSYRPDNEFVGHDQFAYLAVNEVGEVSEATVHIEVTSRAIANSVPVARDLEFNILEGESLVLDGTVSSPGMIELEAFSLRNIQQVQFAPERELLFVRTFGGSVQVIDTVTQGVIDELLGDDITDIDMTPDDRYLFANDRGRSVVHRYDLSTGTWETNATTTQFDQLEAVSGERLLLQELAPYGDLYLMRFRGNLNALETVDSLEYGFNGNLVYDHQNSLVFKVEHGSTGRAYVFRLAGDSLSGIPVYAYGGSLALSPDGRYFYAGQYQYEALDLTNGTNSFYEPIFAASNELAFGATGVYDAESGFRLAVFDYATSFQHVSTDGNHFWVYDLAAETLHHFALRSRSTGLLLRGASDDDGDALRLEIVAPPVFGTLENVQETGELRYVPAREFNGRDEFSYRVFDGRSYSQTAKVAISVHDGDVYASNPVGQIDSYTVNENGVLTVGVTEAASLSVAETYAVAPGTQIVASSQFGYVAIMDATLITVYNVDDGSELIRFSATAQFTDIDITPDGRFLFVADYAGENPFDRGPLGPHRIHRVDLLTGELITKRTLVPAHRLEAVSATSVLIEEGNYHVVVSLVDFGERAMDPIVQQTRSSSRSSGDIEFDHRTNLVFHGTSGSSSHEIHVFVKLDAGGLLPKQNSGTYGTAQGYGPTSTLSSDGGHYYYGKLQVESQNVNNHLNVFPELIGAASPKLAFGTNTYYDALTTAPVGQLGASVSAPPIVTDDSRHLWTLTGTQLRHYLLNDFSGGLLANDFDRDGDSLSAALVSGPEHGEVSLSINGSFTYTPVSGYFGTDVFSYRVSDGVNVSEKIDVIVQVVQANRPPTVASLGPVTLDEDDIVSVPLEVVDANHSADQLTVSALSTSDWLEVSVERHGDTFVLNISPQSDRFGDAEVSVVVSDGALQAEMAFEVVVTPVNDTPIAAADDYLVERGGELQIGHLTSLLRNDVDFDSDGLTVFVVRDTIHGELSVAADGTFVYRPNSVFYGVDLFTYRATDGVADSEETLVTISVVDRIPPVVVASSLDAKDVLLPGDLTIDLQFSELVTFHNDSVFFLVWTMADTPGQTVFFPDSIATSRSELSRTNLTLSFSALHVGEYRLVIADGTVCDVFGNVLDGEFNGSYRDSGDRFAGGTYARTFRLAVATQQVYVTSTEMTVGGGEPLEVTLVYNTSDGNSLLSGLAFRVHFDSTRLSYQQSDEIFSPGLLHAPYLAWDTLDVDANQKTDRFIVFAWNDWRRQFWPGRALPLPLATLRFNVRAASDSAPTQIDFSPITTHTGRLFQADRVTIATSRNAFDVDDNAIIDGRDGELILRYLHAGGSPTFEEMGQTAVNGLLDERSRRVAVLELGQFIGELATFGILDVDDNRIVDAATDGVLIRRYLMGITGDALVEGSVALDAQRRSSSAIEAYLMQFGRPTLDVEGVGDFIEDGSVDASDIDALFAAIHSGEHRPQFDLTADSRVDVRDVEHFVRVVLRTDFGDANLDGRINLADAAIWLENRFRRETGWRAGDFNGDRRVDTRDFSILFSGNLAMVSLTNKRSLREPKAAIASDVVPLLCSVQPETPLSAPRERIRSDPVDVYFGLHASHAANNSRRRSG